MFPYEFQEAKTTLASTSSGNSTEKDLRGSNSIYSISASSDSLGKRDQTGIVTSSDLLQRKPILGTIHKLHYWKNHVQFNFQKAFFV